MSPMMSKTRGYEEKAKNYEKLSEYFIWPAGMLITAAFYHWFFMRELVSPDFIGLVVVAMFFSVLYGFVHNKAADLREMKQQAETAQQFASNQPVVSQLSNEITKSQLKRTGNVVQLPFVKK